MEQPSHSEALHGGDGNQFGGKTEFRGYGERLETVSGERGTQKGGKTQGALDL